MALNAESQQRKTFTQASPQMDNAALTRVINENFNLLRNIFSTWVIYDNDNPRIIIGKQEDGF